MLNANNYSQQVKSIRYDDLSDKLKKGYDFVKKSTHNYTNWDAYHQSDKIKEVINLYFSLVEQHLPSKGSKTKTAAKKAAPAKATKAARPAATKSVKKKTSQENTDANMVEHLDEEIKLIKRFIGLNGKSKTQEQIVRFISTLQKAIIERKVRKSSSYAAHIVYIQKTLIEMYNAMGKTLTVEINAKKLEELITVAGGEKVYLSIPYIKRYLNLVGKTDIKQKATALLKQMRTAVGKGKITKSDRYSDRLSEIHNVLKEFLDNPKQKTIEASTEQLSGLQGIVDGCNCSNLNGIDGSLPAVMNSMDFANLHFNTIGLKGKWLDLIGDPSMNFSAMVSGKPKMGKSYLCIDFAGYLARHHGRVLYVAKEEGLDLTLQTKLNEKDVKHPNLFVASVLPADLSSYNFIFLDSVNKLGLLPHDLTALKMKFPQKSFINIFQTTKDGNFRGANTFQHDVDVVIEIPERGRAVQFGRFNQGGEMNIF
jgi:hypothetical protein